MLPVTTQQKLFCRFYVYDCPDGKRNGTRAAISANYKPHSATVTASKLLSQANIQQEIERLIKGVTEKVEVTHEMLLKEYKALATTDMRDFMDDDDNLLPIRLLSDSAAACIAGVDIEEIPGIGKVPVLSSLKKIKRWNKIEALRALGEHTGFFKVDNAQKQQKTPLTDAQVAKILAKLDSDPDEVEKQLKSYREDIDDNEFL